MTIWTENRSWQGKPMKVKGGRLEFLVPHLLRSQLLRPGFVRMSLRLGAAQQMPSWAKLQFINGGVDPGDLDQVLGRIVSLSSWADEWERLGRTREQAGHDALEAGDRAEATRHLLAAAAAYNFSQYVIFMDVQRKRMLHDSCVRAYATGAPLFDPPCRPFEVMYRRRPMQGYLRVPPGHGPAPVVVIFNGTNAVKEELHDWSDALLQRGIATITFDGPGMGQTFHRLYMVAEPRPIGTAVLNQIETRPELDPQAVAFLGMSLGGYLSIRMAAHDHRIRAVAAVSPPYSADIYWKVTLSGLRRELAGLYGTNEAEMSKYIDRITLAEALPQLECPLMIAGGGHDHITPGTEAWRIFEDAHCDREMIYYPKGAHDLFNVTADLRPRMVNWLARQLERHHRPRPRVVARDAANDGAWMAAEAVDPDFEDALLGDLPPRQWSRNDTPGEAVRWAWPWQKAPEVVEEERIEVVLRQARGVPSPGR
jgi:2,6-dihydroxypseudooxynicotine hydrolase